MPVNLEIKARLSDPDNALLKAVNLNCSSYRMEHQKDTYFKVMAGRLKLREIRDDQSELIYYERKETGDVRVSDYLVCKFPSGGHPGAVLEGALGKIAAVQKKRHIFIYEGARIHLDEIEELGWFIEFEVPVSADPAQGEKLMNKLSQIFDIDKKDIVGVSYLDLMVKKKGISYGE